MDFYFLGTGNAFGHGGRRRSHYYWEGSSSLMIDAGYDAMSGLRSIGKNISDNLFFGYLKKNYSFFADKKLPTFISLMTTEVQRVVQSILLPLIMLNSKVFNNGYSSTTIFNVTPWE